MQGAVQPSTEKEHQIIARTALFVSQHGGQSEIVLRVKQGDNPTFGFLMPHHHLHSYFRYLVDHPELLNSSDDGKSRKGNDSDNQVHGPGSVGALSLLGSVYGEDEDPEPEDAKKSNFSKEMVSEETSSPGPPCDPSNTSILEKQDNAPQKDQRSSDHLHPKEKASSCGKSGASCTLKSKSVRGKKEDALGSSSAPLNNSQLPARSSMPNGESLVIEPPTELKRLIDRIVEIVLKNGQGFEALLIEQDKTHGRFPFLLSTNQYHPYYRKFLKMAQESRAVAASFGSSVKDGSLKQNEEPAVQDFPFDCDRKEKFKMIIGKTKREVHEQPSREPQHQPVGISADAAAAILQAATRGIKNPNLDIFSTNHGSGSDGSLHSSQPQSSLQRQNEVDHPSTRVPVAKEIAKTAAMVAAGEADSSEAGLTKEQKLKAERLKRAKMFAAMIKSGAPKPLLKEPPRGLSVDPPGSGLSGPDLEVGTLANKEREGSSTPADKKRHSDDEVDEKATMKKRHYRSKKHEDKEESDEENERHSRKKHRSHRSSRHHRDGSKDRHKHKRRHSSSKDKESRRGNDSEDDDRHHHHKHKRNGSPEDEYESRKHKRRSSHKDAHEDEKKQKKKLNSGEADLEEGEIVGKSSDQSPSSVVDTANREKSVDRSNTDQEERASSKPADVPEDLRAKIRAMLLATM